MNPTLYTLLFLCTTCYFTTAPKTPPGFERSKAFYAGTKEQPTEQEKEQRRASTEQLRDLVYAQQGPYAPQDVSGTRRSLAAQSNLPTVMFSSDDEDEEQQPHSSGIEFSPGRPQFPTGYPQPGYGTGYQQYPPSQAPQAPHYTAAHGPPPSSYPRDVRQQSGYGYGTPGSGYGMQGQQGFSSRSYGQVQGYGSSTYGLPQGFPSSTYSRAQDTAGSSYQQPLGFPSSTYSQAQATAGSSYQQPLGTIRIKPDPDAEDGNIIRSCATPEDFSISYGQQGRITIKPDPDDDSSEAEDIKEEDCDIKEEDDFVCEVKEEDDYFGGVKEEDSDIKCEVKSEDDETAPPIDSIDFRRYGIDIHKTIRAYSPPDQQTKTPRDYKLFYVKNELRKESAIGQWNSFEVKLADLIDIDTYKPAIGTLAELYGENKLVKIEHWDYKPEESNEPTLNELIFPGSQTEHEVVDLDECEDEPLLSSFPSRAEFAPRPVEAPGAVRGRRGSTVEAPGAARGRGGSNRGRKRTTGQADTTAPKRARGTGRGRGSRGRGASGTIPASTFPNPESMNQPGQDQPTFELPTTRGRGAPRARRARGRGSRGRGASGSIPSSTEALNEPGQGQPTFEVPTKRGRGAAKAPRAKRGGSIAPRPIAPAPHGFHGSIDPATGAFIPPQ